MSNSSSDTESSIFAVSEDLVAHAPLRSAGITTIDFDGLLLPPLKLHEDLKNGCGGMLWPAGMVLSKYLLRNHRESLRGKEIVELGAGGGLVGLAVALGCTTTTILHITDQIPMYALMQQNISLNNLTTNVSASIYDWGTSPPSTIPSQPDILLAADCVYFEPAFPLLQKTLQDLIGENTVCYFCFKRRRRADLGFMKTARKLFDVKEVEDDVDREVWSREKIFLYRITKKKA
ncbi:hypothetical protein K505DRAFT_369725 [Melanomma pulvis-pyrius CBS 109.77]|uniref:Protein-lysine N-methyltransferase EFM6 n=1 Tax=Melanomma pulvis-pyrius CBS 109.77 TaxID=1314802 RepID=A0A6A6XY58_9PLEO|nr:hypothetical protein K505DRAFT_369725 [Melanomma pulvis-pyrius CBS 109.77]